ncbi:hypothetical protein QRD43_21170 [Pelomonas sp. APW6]|uniref:Uncharacterized protein n=1 Tax=Roseateles subflavus TaxID=3053353 RepID=A0ABT7LNM9_9BURK|nr:hypothetical protein [Pelomonas sp. APW6]MDL5034428.1 hypothetical protein [Pelomonas sp. APW6]
MYRTLTFAAVIYGMFLMGGEAIALVFRVGIAWPGLLATTVIIMAAIVGALTFRVLNAQPDVVARGDLASFQFSKGLQASALATPADVSRINEASA